MKERISDVEFLPVELFEVTHGSKFLTGNDAIELKDADTVVLSLAVKGGMRAKWRKKRMRRLRRKRRKMRMRAK